MIDKMELVYKRMQKLKVMGIAVISGIVTIEDKVQKDIDELIYADAMNKCIHEHAEPSMDFDITKLYRIVECAGISKIRDYVISSISITKTSVIDEKSDDMKFFLNKVTIPYDAEALLKLRDALEQLKMDFFETICSLEKVYADVCNIGTSSLFVNTNILSLAIDNALCIYDKHEKMFSSILDVVNTK